jgi:hypothetical protein
MVAERRSQTPCQPVPGEPLPFRSRRVVRRIGEVRLPLAGPYRPRARLYRGPDGRLLWRVRLWEYDRPVLHVVGTPVLRAFARCNRLPDLEAAIEELVARALATAPP